jgi:hypothetical protein
MNARYWWECRRDRLEHEIEELRAAGIPFTIDSELQRAGLLQIRLESVANGNPLLLIVTYPDLYPYFRFEIAAPNEDLPYHQHPLSKYLCLLGRPTHYWSPHDTVAKFVQEQVPNVLETARSENREGVVGREQQQAEPFGDYYPYAPSMVMVQSEWTIPPTERSGTIFIGTSPQQGDRRRPLIYGVVLEVRGNTGKVLAKAARPLFDAYTGPKLSARWLRMDRPVKQYDPNVFFEFVRREDPGRNNNKIQPFNEGRIQIWAVLFPEEVGWRTRGEGWVFICRFERDRKTGFGRATLVPQTGKAIVEKSSYFSRAGRVGHGDVRLRAPELLPLAEKKVALFGLGCLGAPSALELARAGVGQLRILDIDFVDPGTGSRWPFGLSAAGRNKVDVIREFIARDYPFTRVTAYNHRLGATRVGLPGETADQDVVKKMTEGASLVYDATAELGVQHFLSDYARMLRIPYIGVVGTVGGWGGTVVCIDPDRTEGC